MKTTRVACIAAVLVLSSASWVVAGQPLETETARLLSAHQVQVEGTFEFQTSAEGTETAFPLLLEYGLSNRLELALEPVLRADVRPKHGHSAAGAGDLEATLTYLLATESIHRPAVAAAMEVKFPTARNPMLGTRHTDFTGYVIVSRQLGRLDLHGNVGYSILGEPSGVHLNNIFSFAAAAEYDASEHWDLVGEVFANTSAAPGLGEGDTQQSPTAQTAELAGGEAFVMLGTRYKIRPGFGLAMGFVYDNNNAFLIRPGLTFAF